MTDKPIRLRDEIFQDIDGGYSAKRMVLFVLLFVFLILVSAEVIFNAGIGQNILDSVTDLIKWMGGFVASEQVTKFSGFSHPEDKIKIPPPSQPLPFEPYEQ